MELAAELEGRLRAGRPDFEGLSAAAQVHLQRLMAFCPVYRDLLRRAPELALWLEAPENRDHPFRPGAFAEVWGSYNAPQERRARLRLLQRFRRVMLMRIAYRELNGLAGIEQSLRELTALAEFVMREALATVLVQFESRFGQPWDEENGIAARFCVVALGKMGGGELNFVSDLDLIYVYDGRGHCRKAGRATQTPNEEFYARMCRELTNVLQERSEEGFLYNIDLRLRPEGNSGPLVRSLAALEHYYYEAGQTWERLALMKARPIAGSAELGSEILETLNAFRFPRIPPPGLYEEVAGVKDRIEREVLGAGSLERNIKNGRGGIREVEFIIQGIQAVNAGRNPFLQTPSTLQALAGLERYDLLDRGEVSFLREAYLWLRLVEHRLQMRAEEQTQLLPDPGPDYDALAASLGMEPHSFTVQLKGVRDRVREAYSQRFPLTSRESQVQDWIAFMAGGQPTEAIRKNLRGLFWGPLEPVEEGMRRLGRGSGTVVTREMASLMIELVGVLPTVLQPLAHPLRTLGRVNEFADRYGARKRFLRMCAQNPALFRAICLLFDRSVFIHKLVSAHPEILEELLFARMLTLNKPGTLMRREIRALCTDADDVTARRLWLWVKAEQVRIAIAQVLTGTEPARVERALSKLASIAVGAMLQRVDPEGSLAVVAMGKFGGREMSPGSDLDMMVVSAEAATEEQTRAVMRLVKLLTYKGTLGTTFEVDMRLRPHGKDGPLVVSLAALRRYHEGHGGQPWERQALVRARAISDVSPARARRDALRQQFLSLRDALLYGSPPDPALGAEVRHMRRRIEEEKCRLTPPQRCFKVGPGGILDIEFLCQFFQLTHAGTDASLRSPNTRDSLHALAHAGVLTAEDAVTLLDNYNFLRKIEFKLRRQDNQPITELADDPDLHHSIATWMGFTSYQDFWESLATRMRQNRELFIRLLPGS